MIRKIIRNIYKSVYNKYKAKKSMPSYSLVKIQHEIPRDGYVIVKIGNKYYKVRELG